MSRSTRKMSLTSTWPTALRRLPWALEFPQVVVVRVDRAATTIAVAVVVAVQVPAALVVVDRVRATSFN